PEPATAPRPARAVADSSSIPAYKALPSRQGRRRARTNEWSAAGSRRCDGTARTSPLARCNWEPSLACVRAPLSAFCVEVLPHDVQVGDLARQHALERRTTTEGWGAIRPAYPFVGG